jgi:hypothetical protein
MATLTGWGMVKEGKVITSGVQDFTKRRGESNGILFMRFRKWLLDLIDLAPEKIKVIGYEQSHFRGSGTELLLGLQTHAQEVAAVCGIESIGVHSGTLKKFTCGGGKAHKEDMIKKAAIILGRDPIDDNEADAVHVAIWTENEFTSEIERRSFPKKKKKKRSIPR